MEDNLFDVMTSPLLDEEEKFKRFLIQNDIKTRVSYQENVLEFQKNYPLLKKAILVQYDLEKYDYQKYGVLDKSILDFLKSDLEWIFKKSQEKEDDYYGFEFALEPYCRGCSEFSPRSMHFYGDDYAFLTTVVCEHRSKCENIHNRMVEGVGVKYDKG